MALKALIASRSQIMNSRLLGDNFSVGPIWEALASFFILLSGWGPVVKGLGVSTLTPT